MKRRSTPRAAYAMFALCLALAAAPQARGADENAAAADKPIRALLVIGGCCHDYRQQKDILTKGISARANVEWTIAFDPDNGTKHLNPVYESADWSKNFDVIVHDECSADVKDAATIDNILKPHRAGLPAVVLHCAMHSYRGDGYPKATKWFEFTGLASTGHGPQEPIDVTYVDKDHPITQGLADWTTIKEELYNNAAGKLHDTARPLARGKQGDSEAVVAWTNVYDGKANVFGTTLGHNNGTVGDARYLDLVTRGLLWSVGKLDAAHLKPAKKVLMEGANGGKTVLAPENLALGKEASASTNQGDDKAPRLATDGDDSTRWCASGPGAPQWLQVDLGRPEDLTGARITWEFDGAPYRHKIEGSADGKTWTVLVDHTSAPANKQVEENKFDAKGVRYVRLGVTGLNPGAWASLYEFEVLGTKMVQTSAAGSADAKTRKILAGLKAPAGFDLTVFAAPPEAGYPTAIAASPTGEVFVAIDPDGSLGQEKGRGKIVRCVDTDGDGTADSFTDFAKMDHPRGVIWDAGTLYVLHPPFLTAFHDDDNDGKADREDVLVKGITVEATQKARGADHTTNGIRLGVDGWIYVAMGDFGCLDAAGKDGATLTQRGGGVVRVRTDGTGLESYSYGQRNIYDVAIDPFMNLFTRDNTNDGDGWDVRLSHVVPTGQYGYPSLYKHFGGEHVKPLADYGTGSPCGSLFLDEPAMPGGFGQGLYTVEWGRSAVFRHPLTPEGAGFKAGQEKFIDVPRGTDIDVDGQGRLYVSSWNNGGFSYSGPDVGYVIRLAPKGAAPAPFPDMKKADDAQLLKHLVSPSGVCRMVAQREILRRGDKPAIASGLEQLATSGEPLAGRVAALFTLKQLRGPKADATLLDLAKRDDLREFALRALADGKGDASVPAAPFVAALADADPRVRLQAAWGLGRIGNVTDAAAALLPLTADPDPLVSHVAVNSLVAMKAADAALGALDSASGEKVLPGALRVIQAQHDTRVVDAFLPRIVKLQDAARRSLAYAALCRLAYREADWKGDWWGTRPDTTGPYFQNAAWEGTPKVMDALHKALLNEEPAVVRSLIADLLRHKIDFPELPDTVAKAAAADPSLNATLLDVLSRRDALTPAQIERAARLAGAEKETPELRAKAVRVLARNAKDAAAREAAVSAVASVLAAEKPSPALSAAAEDFTRDPRNAADLAYFTKLAESKDPARQELGYTVLLNVAADKLAKAPAKAEAAKVIERGWESPSSAVPLLRAVGRTKAEGYGEWVEAMLTDADADVVRAAGFAAAGLGMKDSGPAPESRMAIATVGYEKTVELVQQEPGDAVLGAELFTKAGCAACHTVTADQAPKGPFLGGISARYKRPELSESILKPNAKIAQGFETQWFKPKSGDLVEGFVTRESGDEVELRNVAGLPVVLKKADVARRGKRDTSIMPEGLVSNLTPRELSSLIAYLESLKGK